MNTASLIIDRNEDIAVLRLNDPDSYNALSLDMKAQLATAVHEHLADGTVRAIVLTGTGDVFCAGGNLKGMSGQSAVETRDSLRRGQELILALHRSEKPVVIALNGLAVGAGFSLALAGDFVIASETGAFLAGFPAVGAVPDYALAYLLPRIVGINRAKDILLTNRRISAPEAMTFGLVARVVGTEKLMTEGIDLARRLAEGPVSAGFTKSLIHSGIELPLERFLELEAMTQAVAFTTNDLTEGINAFREKRRPLFAGN